MLSDELKSLHTALRTFRNQQDELHLNQSQLTSLLNVITGLIERSHHIEASAVEASVQIFPDPVVVDLAAFRPQAKPDPPKGGAA